MSEKQLAASRRNARKSTGPVTPAGKAASSQNAAKTGLYAKATVMKGEKADELQSLIDEYYNQHRPASPELRSIVDQLIQIEWDLRRISRASAQMGTTRSANPSPPTKTNTPWGKRPLNTTKPGPTSSGASIPSCATSPASSNSSASFAPTPSPYRRPPSQPRTRNPDRRR